MERNYFKVAKGLQLTSNAPTQRSEPSHCSSRLPVLTTDSELNLKLKQSLWKVYRVLLDRELFGSKKK